MIMPVIRSMSAAVRQELYKKKHISSLVRAAPFSTVSLVDTWMNSFVIEKGICPWAAGSKVQGELKIVSSTASSEMEALADVSSAAEALLLMPKETPLPASGTRESISRRPTLATALVAFDPAECAKWAKSFASFDAFVLRAGALNSDVSLVAFHPKFNRWRNVTGCLQLKGAKNAPPGGALPPLRPGVEVLAHRQDAFVDEDVMLAADDAARAASDAAVAAGLPASTTAQRNEAKALAKVADEAADMECTFVRSEVPSRALVVAVDENVVGVRNVRLRFMDDDGDGDDGMGHTSEPVRRDSGEDGEDDSEEVVPIDWVVSVVATGSADSSSSEGTFKNGPPPFSLLLADNKLHRSPVPVVHVLRSDVLAIESERAGEISIADLQRRNAHLMREGNSKS
jgi:hypothetical protein